MGWFPRCRWTTAPACRDGRHLRCVAWARPLRRFREGLRSAAFGEGCLCGAERGSWELDGVHSTAVGYAGGYTPNPTYRPVLGEPRPNPGHAAGQRPWHSIPLGDLHHRRPPAGALHRKGAQVLRVRWQLAKQVSCSRMRLLIANAEVAQVIPSRRLAYAQTHRSRADTHPMLLCMNLWNLWITR
jgi:hypothetical protein